MKCPRIITTLAVALFALAVAVSHGQTTYVTTSDSRCGTTSSYALTCFSFPVGLPQENFIGFTSRNTPATAYANHSVMYAVEFYPEFQSSFAPIIDSFTFDAATGIYELRYRDPAGLTEVDLKFAYLAQYYHCGGKGSQSCLGHFWNTLAGSTYTVY